MDILTLFVGFEFISSKRGDIAARPEASIRLTFSGMHYFSSDMHYYFLSFSEAFTFSFCGILRCCILLTTGTVA